MIYLIILSDFDNLKVDKYLKFLFSHYDIVGNPRVILIDSLFLSFFGEKACGLKPMVCDDVTMGVL